MIFALAEKFGISPVEVLKWPAWMFVRARLWMASHNQADADRRENEEAERLFREGRGT